MSENIKRKIYIDVLRIIACLFVIYNHTGYEGFFKFRDINDSFNFFYIFCGIMCRVAVPIFFAITGALLLDKYESTSKTLKRAFKIFICILVFVPLYSCIDRHLNLCSFSFPKDLFVKGYIHLWYLYAYIGLIFSLPVLKKFVKILDLHTTMYLYILAASILTVKPIMEHIILKSPILPDFLPDWMCSRVFIFPIIGYAIEKHINIEDISKKNLISLWIINLSIIIMYCWLQYIALKINPTNFNEDLLKGSMIINLPIIYITVKKLFYNFNINGISYKIITEIGKATYGVYLLHIIFYCKISFLYDFYMKIVNMNSFMTHFGIFFICIIVFIISCFITLILRRIPIIKNYI